ncbi:MAG: Holliday junction branch migration protein RuvA [Actinomycetota bacterium]
MISSLFGRVKYLQPDKAVIEIGGIGFSVVITPTTSARLTIGTESQLFTALVVREDSLTLFGFLDEASRSLFELVQTVSGIGPKVAMSILAVFSPDDLASAVAQESVGEIERVPGIGRKGAQRIILELKGKISSGQTPYIGHVPAWREQLTSALISLGYQPRDADGALGRLVVSLQEEGVDPTKSELSDLLKRALLLSQSSNRGKNSS